MQKFVESKYAEKETVDTDILITSRNGDRNLCNLSEQWRVDFPFLLFCYLFFLHFNSVTFLQ